MSNSCELIELLTGLPSPEKLQTKAHKDDVNEQRRILKSYLDQIESELRIHMPLQLMLRGNEEAKNTLPRQGVLKTIQQAQEGKKDIRQLSTLYKITFVDYPMAEIDSHIDKSGKEHTSVPGVETSVEAYIDEKNDAYQMVNRVKPGCFRIYCFCK